MADDRRLKVRDKRGRVGMVYSMWGSKYCSVQFERDGYWKLCQLDDLEPIEEEEFRKKWR